MTKQVENASQKQAWSEQDSMIQQEEFPSVSLLSMEAKEGKIHLQKNPVVYLFHLNSTFLNDSLTLTWFYFEPESQSMFGC